MTARVRGRIKGEMRNAFAFGLLGLLGCVGVAASGVPTGGAGAVRGGVSGLARSTEGWCQAKTSTSWRHVLSRHIVPLSRTTPLRPMAAANDGRSLFAMIFTPSFTGVAEINVQTSAVTRIRAFPDPTPANGSEQADQAWGAFDGRWLVWNEYRGETNFNDFTTWAWDSRTGDLRQIGAATRGPSGQFWESPWRGPDVRDGVATWVQGVGPDSLGEVHTYDLRSGRDRVVRRGHPSGAFMLAHHFVVWAESPKRGASTRMYTANALTAKRIQTPRALRYANGVSGLYTDGQHIGYPSPRYRSLWWSPSLAKKPQKILTARGLNHIDNDVQINGRYIGFGIWPGVFIADTKTHRYVQIFGHGGSTLINSRTLLASYASHSKLDPIQKVAMVPKRLLPPITACH
jgi:hypothetical protein